MSYSEHGRMKRRKFHPVPRPTPQTPADLDDAKTRYIREVAAEDPGFTPEELHYEIRYNRRRNDITTDMVRYVLAQRNG